MPFLPAAGTGKLLPKRLSKIASFQVNEPAALELMLSMWSSHSQRENLSPMLIRRFTIARQPSS